MFEYVARENCSDVRDKEEMAVRRNVKQVVDYAVDGFGICIG